jgi:hypothetical protein
VTQDYEKSEPKLKLKEDVEPLDVRRSGGPSLLEMVCDPFGIIFNPFKIQRRNDDGDV